MKMLDKDPYLGYKYFVSAFYWENIDDRPDSFDMRYIPNYNFVSGFQRISLILSRMRLAVNADRVVLSLFDEKELYTATRAAVLLFEQGRFNTLRIFQANWSMALGCSPEFHSVARELYCAIDLQRFKFDRFMDYSFWSTVSALLKSGELFGEHYVELLQLVTYLVRVEDLKMRPLYWAEEFVRQAEYFLSGKEMNPTFGQRNTKEFSPFLSKEEDT